MPVWSWRRAMPVWSWRLVLPEQEQQQGQDQEQGRTSPDGPHQTGGTPPKEQMGGCVVYGEEFGQVAAPGSAVRFA